MNLNIEYFVDMMVCIVCSDIESKFCTGYLLIEVQFVGIKWLFDLQIHGVDQHANQEIKCILQAKASGSIRRGWVQFNHSVQSIDGLSTDGRLLDLCLFTSETPLLVHVQVAKLIRGGKIASEARLELFKVLVNGG